MIEHNSTLHNNPCRFDSDHTASHDQIIYTRGDHFDGHARRPIDAVLAYINAIAQKLNPYENDTASDEMRQKIASALSANQIAAAITIADRDGIEMVTVDKVQATVKLIADGFEASDAYHQQIDNMKSESVKPDSKVTADVATAHGAGSRHDHLNLPLAELRAAGFSQAQLGDTQITKKIGCIYEFDRDLLPAAALTASILGPVDFDLDLTIAVYSMLAAGWNAGQISREDINAALVVMQESNLEPHPDIVSLVRQYERKGAPPSARNVPEHILEAARPRARCA